MPCKARSIVFSVVSIFQESPRKSHISYLRFGSSVPENNQKIKKNLDRGIEKNVFQAILPRIFLNKNDTTERKWAKTEYCI